jgi:hypothetical protein
MRVEYAPTLEDAAAFFRYHLNNPARGKPLVPGWFWPLLLTAVIILGLALRAAMPGGFALSGADWFFLALYLLYLLLFFFSSRVIVWFLLNRLRRNPRFFEPRTLELTPEGLVLRAESRERTVPWQTVPRVAADEGHVFIYLTDKAGLTVPRRAFADARQFEEFLSVARDYQQEARRFARTEGQA